MVALMSLANAQPLRSTAGASDVSSRHVMPQLGHVSGTAGDGGPKTSALLNACTSSSTSGDHQAGRGATLEGRAVGDVGPGTTTFRAIAYVRDPVRYRAGTRIAATASIDAEGAFLFSGLSPGEYYVAVISFSTAGRNGELPVVAFAPGTPLLERAQPVTITEGEHVSGVNVRTPAGRPVRVAGHVRNHSGPLLDGTHVMLSPAIDLGVDIATELTQTVMVDREGVFAFDAVMPGEYILTARSIPQSVVQEVATTGRSAPLMRAAGSAFGTVRLELTDRDVDDVAIELSRGGRIAGRVVLGDQAYEPVSTGWHAIAAMPGPGATAGGTLEVRVNGAGAFRLSAVDGLFFLRPAGAMPPLRAVVRAGDDVTDTGRRVVAGESIEDATVVLDPSPTDLYVVAAAELSRDCVVVAFAVDSTLWRLPWTRYVRVAPLVGATARISGLPPGQYAVALTPPYGSDAVTIARLEHLATGARRVELRRGARSEVALTRNGR